MRVQASADFFGILLLFAIEEAMGRAGIDDDLVLDTRLPKRLIKLVHRLHRDALIGAAEEAEYGALELGHAVDGPCWPSWRARGEP